MKYEFEECIRRLNAEIQAVYKSNQIKAGILEMFKPVPEPKLTNEQQKIIEATFPPKQSSTSPQPAQQSQPQVISTVQATTTSHVEAIAAARVPLSSVKELNWTESQVLKWFTEKRIDPAIVKNVSPCDGRVLYELFLIKHETPEFFYKSVGFAANSFKSPSLREIALFSYELKKLFLS